MAIFVLRLRCAVDLSSQSVTGSDPVDQYEAKPLVNMNLVCVCVCVHRVPYTYVERKDSDGMW